jgi:hypothetical protein
MSVGKEAVANMSDEILDGIDPNLLLHASVLKSLHEKLVAERKESHELRQELIAERERLEAAERILRRLEDALDIANRDGTLDIRPGLKRISDDLSALLGLQKGEPTR